MRKRSMVYTLILTYGLMFFLDGSIKNIWGNEPCFIKLPESVNLSVQTQYPNKFQIVAIHN